MRSIKTLGLAAVMALVLVACVGATSASATTICTVGTSTSPCAAGQHPGGAFVAKSTNSSLTIPGFPAISCTTSTISGTAPTTTATTVSAPVTLRYGAATSPAGTCSAFLFSASVTVPPACDPGGAAPLTLNAEYNAGAPWLVVTIPSGCTISVDVPAISCTITVSGHQSIGNGTAGAGGIPWTNGTSSVFSSATINNAVVAAHSSGGGFGCPPSGNYSATLSGKYTVTSPTPAPGVTIIN